MSLHHTSPGHSDREPSDSLTSRAVPIRNDEVIFFPEHPCFPWAIQMLTDIRPNCTMLDATFRILRSYSGDSECHHRK
jgi:hypothetical protein